MNPPLFQRLGQTRPLLLDGPTGTELTRRSVPIDGPCWSASALLSSPEIVRQIHADYLAAGAEIVTANTFRTHSRNLQHMGWADRSRELTHLAVELAREAAGGEAWVAGSQAPLEDCYRPDLVPPTTQLEREHAAMSESLADADVDLILVETHNCIREAEVAARCAMAVGLPVLVSFVCGSDGRLLSGESVPAAAQAVLPYGPSGVLVNCLPVAAVPVALADLLNVCTDVPVGAYANAGALQAHGGWTSTDAARPAVYAAAAAEWLALGARMIGGCCGTTPEHIAALCERLDRCESADPL